MTNMIRSAEDQAEVLIRAACERAAAAGALPAGGEGIKAAVALSGDAAHGDCASSFAMAGARVLRMSPRAVARAVADNLELEGSYFDRVEIAGPGFLNFTLGPGWYGDVLAAVEAEGAARGSGSGGAGKGAPVELVPAGPSRIDSARASALRDALANLLARDVPGDGSRRTAVVPVGPVNLLRDGKPAEASGLDGVPADAARYWLTSRAAPSPLNFDLDLAVRQDGGNPAYLVRYTHARICSLLSRLAEEPAAAADAARLSAPEEKTLVKSLARYPEELRLAARDLDPSRVNRYLAGLAGDFRRFYNVCRLKEEGTVLPARIRLADAVRAVLADGLNLLGVTAPERM